MADLRHESGMPLMDAIEVADGDGATLAHFGESGLPFDRMGRHERYSPSWCRRAGHLEL
jgi:hypothetical protein